MKFFHLLQNKDINIQNYCNNNITNYFNSNFRKNDKVTINLL